LNEANDKNTLQNTENDPNEDELTEDDEIRRKKTDSKKSPKTTTPT